MQALTTHSQSGSRWFEQHKVMPFNANRRMAVRFRRNDVHVSLKRSSHLNLAFGSFKDAGFAKLLDISSKGVAVACDMKLAVNSKIILTIIFSGKDSFDIPAKVVRTGDGKQAVYGIKFDKVDDAMAECLVNVKHLAFR